jgi:hypothetical protein
VFYSRFGELKNRFALSSKVATREGCPYGSTVKQGRGVLLALRRIKVSKKQKRIYLVFYSRFGELRSQKIKENIICTCTIGPGKDRFRIEFQSGNSCSRMPLWLQGKIEVFYSRFGELRPQKLKENICIGTVKDRFAHRVKGGNSCSTGRMPL